MLPSRSLLSRPIIVTHHGAATASSAPLCTATFLLCAFSGWLLTHRARVLLNTQRARADPTLFVHRRKTVMALLSLTMPMGFHGVRMAPPTSIRMGFIDGKPGTNAIPTDFAGQVCIATSLPMSQLQKENPCRISPPRQFAI